MKRIQMVLVLATTFVGLAFAPLAGAAQGKTGTLEINAGYSKSSQEVVGNEPMGGGISFGAGYWKSASPLVSWGAEASFDNLGTVEYDNGNTPNNEIKGTVFRVNPAVRVNFTPRTLGPAFFAQAGAGLYNVKSEITDSIDGNLDDSQSKFGMNVGAGVSFQVAPKSRMNISALYHSVSLDNNASTNYIQFRAGFGFRL